jgi:AcrR family transcriptional regulator
MAGLRDKQRSGRRSRILITARQLFNRLGYEATTLDEIAAQSELSSVTVLNYFGSKGGLLVAIQTQFDAELNERIAPIIASPPDDPIFAVFSFFATVFDHALSTMDRHVWKHVWANLFLEAGTEIGRGFAANERELLEQFIVLLQAIKSRHQLREDTDVRIMGEVLYNLQSVRSMQFMSDTSTSRARLDELMRQDFTLVMKNYLTA